jgi:hypothetical protein
MDSDKSLKAAKANSYAEQLRRDIEEKQFREQGNGGASSYGQQSHHSAPMTREQKIAMLQDRLEGNVDSMQQQQHPNQRAGASESDKYHNAAVTGSTSNYFENRVAQQDNKRREFNNPQQPPPAAPPQYGGDGGGGGGLTREQKIAQLQDRVSGGSPSAAPHRQSGNPNKRGTDADAYHNTSVTGSTANYFENRVAEQNTRKQAFDFPPPAAASAPSNGGEKTREQKIAALQDRVSNGANVQQPARKSGNPNKKGTDADAYHNTNVTGSTANYFENRVAEQSKRR